MTDIKQEHQHLSPANANTQNAGKKQPGLAVKRRYVFGDYTFYPANQQLLYKGAKCHLESKMLQLLLILIEARPNLVSKQDLMEQLWPNTVVSEWSLARLVSDTRKLLDDNGKQQSIIKTVRGQGFSFSSEVDEIIQAYEQAEQIQSKPSEGFAKPSGVSAKWWPAAITIAGLMLAAFWSFNYSNPKAEALIEPLEMSQKTSDLLSVMQEVQRNLQLTKTTFIAQVRRRDELGELLTSKQAERVDMSWEQRLRMHYPDMNEDERFIFDQIRAMTEGPMHEGNRNIVELLEQYPDLYQELPLFNQLHAHLKIWLSKYDRVFLEREDMALLYVGVEDGVPFPKEIDQQVEGWLAERDSKSNSM